MGAPHDVTIDSIELTQRFRIYDLCQQVPAGIGCLMTCVTTYRHGLWFWLVGLAFGIADGPMIELLFGLHRHFSPLLAGVSFLSGPALFYADMLVTSPLIAVQMQAICSKP